MCEELMTADVNEKLDLRSNLLRFYSADVTNQLLCAVWCGDRRKLVSLAPFLPANQMETVVLMILFPGKI